MSFAVHHFEIETNWNSSELPGKLEVFMCKIRRGRGIDENIAGDTGQVLLLYLGSIVFRMRTPTTYNCIAMYMLTMHMLISEHKWSITKNKNRVNM